MTHQPDTADLARRVMEAAEKATAGPWACDEVRTSCGRAFRIGASETLEAGKGACIIYDDYGNGANARAANAAFISLSRTAAPALAQAVLEKDAEIERLREALRAFLKWADQKCPCYNDEPNPCPLCGASVENLEGCKAADNTLPRDLLFQARTALKES